jgi:hypothetical protein
MEMLRWFVMMCTFRGDSDRNGTRAPTMRSRHRGLPWPDRNRTRATLRPRTQHSAPPTRRQDNSSNRFRRAGEPLREGVHRPGDRHPLDASSTLRASTDRKRVRRPSRSGRWPLAAGLRSRRGSRPTALTCCNGSSRCCARVCSRASDSYRTASVCGMAGQEHPTREPDHAESSTRELCLECGGAETGPHVLGMVARVGEREKKLTALSRAPLHHRGFEVVQWRDEWSTGHSAIAFLETLLGEPACAPLALVPGAVRRGAGWMRYRPAWCLDRNTSISVRTSSSWRAPGSGPSGCRPKLAAFSR